MRSTVPYALIRVECVFRVMRTIGSAALMSIDTAFFSSDTCSHEQTKSLLEITWNKEESKRLKKLYSEEESLPLSPELIPSFPFLCTFLSYFDLNRTCQGDTSRRSVCDYWGLISVYLPIDPLGSYPQFFSFPGSQASKTVTPLA